MTDGPGRPRRLTVAIPPTGDIQTKTVVYCTDGQVVEILAGALHQSVLEFNLPVLVGVHSDPELRAQEYLFSPDDLFQAHDTFFAETVRLWAHEKFGTSTNRLKSVVFGFSNGGAYALATALRHPDRFMAAIALSVPPFGPLPTPAVSAACKPAIYIAAGNQGPEKSIRKNVSKLVRTLLQQGFAVEYCERNAGHTLDFWASEFAAAIRWVDSMEP